MNLTKLTQTLSSSCHDLPRAFERAGHDAQDMPAWLVLSIVSGTLACQKASCYTHLALKLDGVNTLPDNAAFSMMHYFTVVAT